MSSRARALAIVGTATAVLVAVVVLDATAQVPTLPTIPTTTTTTQPPNQPGSSSTTTTTAPLLPDPSTRDPETSTTEEEESSTTTTIVPPAPGDEPGGGGGDSSQTGTTAPKVLPPGAQEIINRVVRTKASNTRALLKALAPLEDYGLTSREAAIVGFGRFPVAGEASYVHDWLYPRFVPTFHFHQGTDIFAVRGTPVRAPANGKVRITNGAIGGLAVYVVQPNGTYWYMAHLAAVQEGLTEGQEVEIGDVVGYVGDSGNARGGAPHVHFEIHPNGGGAVDPKPHLDQFIADALADVPRLLSSFGARRPRPLVAAGLVRTLVDETLSSTQSHAQPSRTQLLWASSANPAGGALHLASAEASEAAGVVDWDARASREQARQAAWHAADVRARAYLSPLSVPGVAKLMETLGPHD